MDAHTTIAVAQQFDPFQLLDKVNAFYNQAWVMLLVYTGIAAAIVGIVVPFVIQFYQKQFYVLEKKNIEDELKAYINKEVEDKFKKEREQLELNLTTHKEGIKKELAGVTALIFHAQAVQEANRGAYLSATDSILASINSYIKTDDGKNFKRALGNLKGYLSHLESTNIEWLKREGHDFDAIIAEISKYDNKGYFFDLLNDIKEALNVVRAKK